MVISRVVSPRIWVMTTVTVLITPLTSSGDSMLAFRWQRVMCTFMLRTSSHSSFGEPLCTRSMPSAGQAIPSCTERKPAVIAELRGLLLSESTDACRTSPELKLLLVASGSVSFETQPYNEL